MFDQNAAGKRDRDIWYRMRIEMAVPQKNSLEWANSDSLEPCSSGSEMSSQKMPVLSIAIRPETNELLARLVVKVASATAATRWEVSDE